ELHDRVASAHLSDFQEQFHTQTISTVSFAAAQLPLPPPPLEPVRPQPAIRGKSTGSHGSLTPSHRTPPPSHRTPLPAHRTPVPASHRPSPALDTMSPPTDALLKPGEDLSLADGTGTSGRQIAAGTRRRRRRLAIA